MGSSTSLCDSISPSTDGVVRQIDISIYGREEAIRRALNQRKQIQDTLERDIIRYLESNEEEKTVPLFEDLNYNLRLTDTLPSLHFQEQLFRLGGIELIRRHFLPEYVQDKICISAVQNILDTANASYGHLNELELRKCVFKTLTMKKTMSIQNLPLVKRILEFHFENSPKFFDKCFQWHINHVETAPESLWIDIVAKSQTLGDFKEMTERLKTLVVCVCRHNRIHTLPQIFQTWNLSSDTYLGIYKSFRNIEVRKVFWVHFQFDDIEFQKEKDVFLSQNLPPAYEHTVHNDAEKDYIAIN